MPQSLLKGQLKEKPTYRVWCLYSSFVHEIYVGFLKSFLAGHQTRAEFYLSFPSLSVSSLSMAESILPLFASRVEQLDKAKTTAAVLGLQ
jgi:hypothetical protein